MSGHGDVCGSGRHVEEMRKDGQGVLLKMSCGMCMAVALAESVVYWHALFKGPDWLMTDRAFKGCPPMATQGFKPMVIRMIQASGVPKVAFMAPPPVGA